jgi:hypothetical protein
MHRLTLAMRGVLFFLSACAAAALGAVSLVFLGAVTGWFAFIRLVKPVQSPWVEEVAAARWTWFLLTGEDRGGHYGSGLNLDVLVFTIIIGSVLLIAAGSLVLRAQTAEPLVNRGLSGDRRRRALSGLSRFGAALVTAGAVASFLEIAGLWQRMVLHPDPRREQGAPFWVWCVMVTVSLVLWVILSRRQVSAWTINHQPVSQHGGATVSVAGFSLFCCHTHRKRDACATRLWRGL